MFCPTARRALAALTACVALSPVSLAVADVGSGSGSGSSAAAVAAPAVPEPPRLPSLGEPDIGELSEVTERRLGELIMRQIRRDPAYLDDPQLLGHLQSLWAPLMQAARTRGEIVFDTDELFAWETFLIRDKSINAFALPGGYVGVHLGLMAQSVAQDELAAVLAHELAHVTQRHIARSNSQARRQSLLGMATMVLGILAAARANSTDLAQASVMGSQAAIAQAQLNFSRDMEREADRIGLTIMTDAGYAPAGVAAMFERLDKASRLNDSGRYPYLRSHPLTIERIAEARARVEAMEHAQGQARAAADQTVVITAKPLGPGIPMPEVHALMRARARVLMDTSVPALHHWLAMARNPPAGPEWATVMYSAVMAASLLHEHAQARRHLQALQAAPMAEAARRSVALLAAEQALAAGDAASAWTILSGLDAQQRPVRILRAQAALMAWERSTDAATRSEHRQRLRHESDALSAWVIEHRQDALAWSQLAFVSRALGQGLRAIRAEAESRWSLGDLNGALDRLKAGQRASRTASVDLIEASVIDSRLRDLEAARRRAFAEMRGVREDDLPPVLPPNVPL